MNKSQLIDTLAARYQGNRKAAAHALESVLDTITREVAKGEKVVQRLWDHLEDKPGSTVTVDLESRTVKAGDGPDAIEDSFDIDDYTRWRLLEGLDDIGITLSHEDDIETFEKSRPSWKPATIH